MFGTVVVYALIFLTIRTHARRHPEDTHEAENGNNQVVMRRAARYMIIYPVVYVICTLPLAGGRMASMTGSAVPYWWYCLAGAAITCSGWLDVLLYACTRRVLVFSAEAPAPDDVGLDTFGWKYSREGYWGTTTTISGGDGQSQKHDQRDFFSRATTRSVRGRDSEERHLADQPEGVITTKTEFEIRSGSIPQYILDSAPLPRSSETSGYDSEGKGVRELVLMNEGGLQL